MKIGYFGFNQTSFELSQVLRAGGFNEQHAYSVPFDKASYERLTDEAGVMREVLLKDLFENCDWLFVMVLAERAQAAADAAKPFMRPGQLYIDMTFAPPAIIRTLGATLVSAGALFVDAVYDTPLNETKPASPILISGNGADVLMRDMQAFGIDFVKVGDSPGDAAAVGLIRNAGRNQLRNIVYAADIHNNSSRTLSNNVILHDSPESQGAANAIKRAKQLLNIQWTPIKPLPKTTGQKTQGVFEANTPVTGLPYSSVRAYDKYLGCNISLETFMTALQNPNSIVYTENLFGIYDNATTYYGIVCSAFVSYALNLPCRMPTKVWSQIRGMHKIGHRSAFDVRLCDTLLSKTHAAIIIDITRTPDGKVHSISVAEATRPKCICNEFSAEQFESFWFKEKDFDVYRYDALAAIPYETSPYVTTENEEQLPVEYNMVLGLNYGNKSNYKKGETVVYSVMAQGYRELLIEKDGQLKQTVALSKEIEQIALVYDECGSYEAYCIDDEGMACDKVSFKIIHAFLSAKRTHYQTNESIVLTFDSDSDMDSPSYLFLCNESKFTQHVKELSCAEVTNKQAVISYATPGDFCVKVFYKNDFGIYSSDYLTITIH